MIITNYTDEVIDYAAYKLFKYESKYTHISGFIIAGPTKTDWYDVSEEIQEMYRNKIRIVMNAMDEKKNENI